MLNSVPNIGCYETINTQKRPIIAVIASNVEKIRAENMLQSKRLGSAYKIVAAYYYDFY
jgi:hypothetical protein